ncbi:hypothetical protein [Marinisporobacter balticus]|uniref:Uncharacterized protein n=1 Tax=Marinisporobacter balticus TaxID=2018667 RepID=A0A4R2L0R2_9FIRM|nr:hypothetical protein [Marinisporobacter balticus]TCO79833.1 hypothetical protein EV214_10164 [Marinisporobacter balticus]
MYKVVTHNQFYLIGKVSDLLEVLEDLSHEYTTLKDLIEDHLKP